MTEPIRFRVLPDTFAKKAGQAAQLTPVQMTAFISRAIHTAHANVVKRTPVGWSGATRGGYAVEIRRPNTPSPVGILANPIIYHDFVEDGRKPGKMPPVEALIPWVGSKLGIPPGPERRSAAFLIARKIGATGTTGAHMVKEGWEETRAGLKPEMKQLGLRIVAKLK